MDRETGVTDSVEREEVQLISREEKLPKEIRIKSFVSGGKQKGLRFREWYRETRHQRLMARQLYYDVWRKHPWVRALVNKIANIATTVGFHIAYEGEGELDKKAIKMITSFFEYPNYKQSFADILWKTIVQLKLFYESFWEVVKSPEGYPKDYWVLDGPIIVRVDEHGNPLVPAYVQKVRANIAEFNYDEIVHFKFLDPMGRLYPSPELEALELSVLTDIYAMQLNKNTFTKGVRKGKAFIFPADTGDEQMKRNREQIENLHQGIQGAFSAFIAFEGECTVQDLDLFETKMEAKELREYLRDEIAAVIGTPLSKVGIEATDVKESDYIDRSFFQEEVQPILGLVEGAINRYLDLCGIQDYRFRFRKFPIRDLKEYARFIDVLKKHGLASMDDIREMIGMKRLGTKSSNVPYLMTRDGTVVVTSEILEEKKRLDETKEKELKSGFSFNVGSRKVLRKGKSVPSYREDEEVSDEEDESPDPFH